MDGSFNTIEKDGRYDGKIIYYPILYLILNLYLSFPSSATIHGPNYKNGPGLLFSLFRRMKNRK